MTIVGPATEAALRIAAGHETTARVASRDGDRSAALADWEGAAAWWRRAGDDYRAAMADTEAALIGVALDCDATRYGAGRERR